MFGLLLNQFWILVSFVSLASLSAGAAHAQALQPGTLEESGPTRRFEQDVQGAWPLASYLGHDSNVSNIAFLSPPPAPYDTRAPARRHPDFLSLGTDGQLFRWRAQQAAPVWSARWQDMATTALALSPDESSVLVGGRSGLLVHVDVATGKEILRYDVPGGLRTLVARAQRNGPYFAAGQDDGHVRLYKSGFPAPVATFGPLRYPIVDVLISPDSSQVFAVSLNRIVGWDVQTGERVIRIVNPDGGDDDIAWITSASFTPGGELLAVGSNDGLRLFSPGRGAQIARFDKAHRASVTLASFTDDGRFLVSGDVTGTAKLWSVPDFKTLTTIGMVFGSVGTPGFSRDNRFLASGGVWRVVQVFALSAAP